KVIGELSGPAKHVITFCLAPDAFGKDSPRQSTRFPHRIELDSDGCFRPFLSIAKANAAHLCGRLFASARDSRVCHSRRRPAFRRHGALRSPLPTSVAPPLLLECRASRSPLRYVGLVASLCSCICPYLTLALFYFPPNVVCGITNASAIPTDGSSG